MSCIICDKSKADIDIHLNDNNGIVLYSHNENICQECFKNNSRVTAVGIFLKIKGRLYHDGCGFRFFENVDSKEQLDKIFNREYYEILDMLIKASYE